MRRILGTLLLLGTVPAVLSLALMGPHAAGASGPEFQVSSFHSPRLGYAYPFGPAAAMADSGDFLVVWASFGPGGLGTISGRAFDASDAPWGGELSLGYGAIFGYVSDTPDASAGGGQFVVVWTKNDGDTGSGTYYYDVKGQRLGLQGDMVGSQIDVTSSYPNFGYNAEVAVEPGGDFIVVWDMFRLQSRLRRFDSAGEPFWPEEGFPTGANAGPPDPDIALDGLGNSAVVWSHIDSAGPDGIFGSRFDVDGEPLGDAFQISEFASGKKLQPAVAPLPNGGFVAVWATIGQDGDRTGVFGRIIGVDGMPLSPEFAVNTATTGAQHYPDVGADD